MKRATNIYRVQKPMLGKNIKRILQLRLKCIPKNMSIYSYSHSVTNKNTEYIKKKKIKINLHEKHSNFYYFFY